MQRPIKFIRVLPNQMLEIEQEALEFISTLRTPIHVISIAGVAREGKSAFLSLMMRIASPSPTQHCGLKFKVNDGVHTETEGAWIWGTNDFETTDGITGGGSLLLIDTQGLAKGAAEGLNRLFAMTTLLSSVVVMNCRRILNDDTMNKLNVPLAL